jgi:hypothetical protein
MDNLYYLKYLKYRSKYLALKNQIGGANCDRCGFELSNCICNSRFDDLSPLLLDNIISGLDLNGLNSFAESNPKIKLYINRRLRPILLNIMHNTPQELEIIKASLDVTNTHLEMRTINNLIKIRTIFAKFENLKQHSFYGSSFNITEFTDLVNYSLTEQRLLDLLSYLFSIYEIPHDLIMIKDIFYTKIRNETNFFMTPTKAAYLLQMLKHQVQPINMTLLFSFIASTRHFNDELYRLLFKFISTNQLNMVNGPNFVAYSREYGLTDDEFELVIRKYGQKDPKKHRSIIENFIRGIIRERK